MEAQHIRDFTALKGMLDEDWTRFYAGTEAEVFLRALVDSRVFTEVEGWAKRALDSGDPKEVIKAAVIAEKRSILLYYAMLEATKGRSKEIVREILRQEKAHLAALSEAYRRLEEGHDLSPVLNVLTVGQPRPKGG